MTHAHYVGTMQNRQVQLISLTREIWPGGGGVINLAGKAGAISRSSKPIAGLSSVHMALYLGEEHSI